MQAELLRILRKSNDPVSIEYLSKIIGRSNEDIENAISRMKKLVKNENGMVSLK